MNRPTPRHFAPRSLLWSELSRQELSTARDQGALVLIPTGSTEQHADHLPVETDTFLSAAITELAASRMVGTPVLVAPPVAFGFAPHHLSWPGTISLRLETYLAMLGDIARSVMHAGFPRAIFVNGHGGNSAPLRALTGQLICDGLAVGMVDYFAPSQHEWVALLQGDLARAGHACEQETALMMALSDAAACDRIRAAITSLPPRLTQPWVAPGVQADPVTDAGAGWAAIFQGDDCGYFGDPGAASVQTGADILEVTVNRLARFLEAFARAPLRLGVASDPQRPGFALPALSR